MINRRESLKLSGAAALALLGTKAGPALARPDSKTFKVAGYSYDRVLGIKDGQVGLEQAGVSFHDNNIYDMNDSTFGPEKRFEITEIGLIPYVTKYVNEDFE